MKFITCALLFTLISCSIFSISVVDAADRIVCYFGSWATYRYGNGQFDVENIDPTLCTHLIYTFIGLNDDGSIHILDPYNDLDDNWGKGGFRRFNNLRKISPTARTSIAIGGWNEGSETYSQVMRNDNLRANFVQSAVNFLIKYKFDGLDLDWEYPNQRGGEKIDMENYVQVLKELKEAFAPHGFLLSAAVAAAKPSVIQSYIIPEVSNALDFINVMAYDLHGPWDSFTGENAPLYPLSIETDYQKELNVIACIDTWLKGGADPSKINLGMGTYGRTFRLSDIANNSVGAPASGPGDGGPYTNEPGMIGYNEIIEVQNKGGWTDVWNEEQKVPYMYKGEQWIGYENPKSIDLKVKYAISKNLGGCMIWSVETDDFHGLSGEKYPLLKTINSAMGRKIPDTTTSLPDPSTITTTTTTSNTEIPPRTTSNPQPKTTTRKSSTSPGPQPDPAKWCKVEGYIRDQYDCSKFYYCQSLGNGKFNALPFYCTTDLVYDLKLNVCNYRYNTDCSNNNDK